VQSVSATYALARKLHQLVLQSLFGKQASEHQQQGVSAKCALARKLHQQVLKSLFGKQASA